MFNKCSIILIAVLFFIPILLNAQSEQNNLEYNSLKGLRQTRGFLDHLLNPNNINMSHSYSISCFNIGGQTASQGLYLNTINYRIADPIMMQVRFGYLHHPFGGMKGMQSENGSNGQFFLQSARFKYQPSKNMTFTIDFQQIPQTMISPYGYYDRHRYNRSNFPFDK